MSRQTRERRLQAEEKWPNLCQFLGCLQGNGPILSGTPEAAVDQGIAAADLQHRQAVVREWKDWNGRLGWRTDVAAFVNDGLGVNVPFASEIDARQFMNMVHDRLITSVRAETTKDWNP